MLIAFSAPVHTAQPRHSAYNSIKIHRTLRVTPAMAAGVTDAPNNPKSKSGSGPRGTGALGTASGRAGADDSDGRQSRNCAAEQRNRGQDGKQSGIAPGAIPTTAAWRDQGSDPRR